MPRCHCQPRQAKGSGIRTKNTCKADSLREGRSPLSKAAGGVAFHPTRLPSSCGDGCQDDSVAKEQKERLCSSSSHRHLHTRRTVAGEFSPARLTFPLKVRHRSNAAPITKWVRRCAPARRSRQGDCSGSCIRLRRRLHLTPKVPGTIATKASLQQTSLMQSDDPQRSEFVTVGCPRRRQLSARTLHRHLPCTSSP